MKTNKLRTALVSLVAVSVIAVGATAFAGKGMGNQGDERGYGGCGKQNRRGGCAYGQMNADLTPEQREQMETERQAFRCHQERTAGSVCQAAGIESGDGQKPAGYEQSIDLAKRSLRSAG